MFTLVNIAVPLTFLLLLWTYSVEETAHYTPDYPMEDISIYLEQETLTEEEYALVYRQTGLAQMAVDALRKEGRTEELLGMQQRFFAEAEVGCERDFLLFNEVLVNPHKSRDGRSKILESINENVERQKSWHDFIPVLEDGDIIITFNSHFLGWRNGHAAIVIDAEKGRTLEALSLGKNSTILSVKSWKDCPSFVILRLAGVSEEQRAEIAEYAEENLVGIPYRLTAGVWEGLGVSSLLNLAKVKAGSVADGALVTELLGTHCAHLIWHAYNQFGYDLDSDGGLIVTPRDLYDSPLLQIVQVYGMEPR